MFPTEDVFGIRLFLKE